MMTPIDGLPLGLDDAPAPLHTLGRWLDASDIIGQQLRPAVHVGFPRNWPAVFKQSPTLKALVNGELKGVRCRAIAIPPLGEDAIAATEAVAAASIKLHAFHAFSNAAKLVAALPAWQLIKGFILYERLDEPPATSFVAVRHWWVQSPGGTWLDLTPPMTSNGTRTDGAADTHALLVESPLGEKPEAPLSTTQQDFAVGLAARLRGEASGGGVAAVNEAASSSPVDISAGGGYISAGGGPATSAVPHDAAAAAHGLVDQVAAPVEHAMAGGGGGDARQEWNDTTTRAEADALFRRGDEERAEDMYRALVQPVVAHALADKEAGNAAFKRGQHQVANGCYESGLKRLGLDPNQFNYFADQVHPPHASHASPVHLPRASHVSLPCLPRISRVSPARLPRASHVSPVHFPSATSSYVVILRWQAAAEYGRVLRQATPDGLVGALHSNRAAALLRLDKFDEAEQAAGKALKEKASDVKARVRRASALRALHRPAGAAADLVLAMQHTADAGARAELTTTLCDVWCERAPEFGPYVAEARAAAAAEGASGGDGVEGRPDAVAAVERALCRALHGLGTSGEWAREAVLGGAACGASGGVKGSVGGSTCAERGGTKGGVSVSSKGVSASSRDQPPVDAARLLARPSVVCVFPAALSLCSKPYPETDQDGGRCLLRLIGWLCGVRASPPISPRLPPSSTAFPPPSHRLPTAFPPPSTAFHRLPPPCSNLRHSGVSPSRCAVQRV